MGWANIAVQMHDGDKPLPRRVYEAEYPHDAARTYEQEFGLEPVRRHSPNEFGFPYIMELCETDDDVTEGV